MIPIKALLIAGTLLLSSMSLQPVAAQHHDHNGDGYRDHGPGRHNNWKNQKQYKKQVRKAQRRAIQRSWADERSLYRNNWGRLSPSQRARYDAQMRAQWRAYHHNNWNGSYSWNQYSDPGFLDYVHTQNPGLLTNLRTYLGF